MIFNKHYNLKDQHAFLSPSSPYWLRYDENKLINAWNNAQAASMGTRLHEFAASAIELGQKLPRSNRTVNMYVNDSIGYKQSTEQKLYFSDNCFGTADSIQFRNRLLRIFDLKTGVSPVHTEQLEIYAALFCLEYNINPQDIQMDLRIYQNDIVNQWEPTPDCIQEIINIIKKQDAIINKMKEEVIIY